MNNYKQIRQKSILGSVPYIDELPRALRALIDKLSPSFSFTLIRNSKLPSGHNVDTSRRRRWALAARCKACRPVF